MELYVKKILNFLLKEDDSLINLDRTSWPEWLRDSRWIPNLVLSRNENIIAIDIARSGNVPHVFYRDVLVNLRQKHKTLKIIVCLPKTSFDQSPDTANFCHSLGMEVRLIGFGIGLETLSPSTFPVRKEELERPIRQGVGQFPQPILDRARGLNNIIFADILNDFIVNIARYNDSESDALALVNRTIDTLLQKHPHFRVGQEPFMRLVSFENLLKIVSINSSDHVFHSFRVFLAGCPIINEFYTQFTQSSLKFTICPPEELHVEYIWLLAALFHDIGRPKEFLYNFVSQTFEDDEIGITGKLSRWDLDRYHQANRILGSLGAFMGSKTEGHWDGGAVDDQDGINLCAEWTSIYDCFNCHGIISAYDFLANILGMMTAASERDHRQFMISHAPLAAMAILLHDWRLWEKAKKWKLFPIEITRNPLAALLIYIDTWDDYKRKVGGPDITIAEYEVNSRGAKVIVEWENAEALHGEDRKYRSFRESIIGGPPHFWIETRTR